MKKSQLETVEVKLKELAAEMRQASESSEQEIKWLKEKVTEVSLYLPCIDC